MAAMAAMVMIPGGVRRPYGALQWVVADPVAESVVGSDRLPAAGSGRLQAVCDKWKICLSAATYRRSAGDYADYKERVIGGVGSRKRFSGLRRNYAGPR